MMRIRLLGCCDLAKKAVGHVVPIWGVSAGCSAVVGGEPSSCFSSLSSAQGTSYHWCSVSNPAELMMSHEARWYRVPPADAEQLNFAKILPKYYKRQIETFEECCFLVRRSTLDLVHCLRGVDPDSPVPRFVLYGPFGTGKSLTLHQLLHFGFRSDYVLVFLRSVIEWNRAFREIAMSSWKPGRIDLPLEAADFLTDFKRYNSRVVEQLKLVNTTKEYQWGKRDVTPVGTPILDLVDVGINRVRYASDCVGALFRELKLAASEKKIKMLVLADDANSLFHTTKIRREDRSFAPAADVTLNHHVKELLKRDWNNGAAVIAVDKKEFSKPQEGLARISPLPYFLLGKEGFDWLDPFVPVETRNYSTEEVHSCLDYYLEKNWIQNPRALSEEGRKQLHYLSDSNPFLLERICAAN